MIATSGAAASSSSGSLSSRAFMNVAGPRNCGPSTWASRLGVFGIRLEFSQPANTGLEPEGEEREHEAPASGYRRIGLDGRSLWRNRGFTGVIIGGTEQGRQHRRRG